MKKFLLLILLLCSVFGLVFASDADSERDIMMSDVPITIGEEAFVNRIKANCGERTPVGLVLSGGSARALAHVGVLKYLESQGVVPDYIVANSMGSIVALLYGAGMSPDEIGELFNSLDLSKLFELQLPVNRGLISTEKFNALFSELLGQGYNLDDTVIPVMLIAEDLHSRRQVRICTGDAVTALSASMSLPAYFTPIVKDGFTLTDGGITDLVPVEAAKVYSDNLIVSTAFLEREGNLLNPITVVNESMSLAKSRNGAKQLKDNPDVLLIRCDVEQFSFMDFDKYDEMVQRGWSTAMESAEQIAALSENNGGLTAGILQARADFAVRLPEVLNRFLPFNHIKTQQGNFKFAFVSETEQRPVFRLPKAQTLYLGLGPEYTNGNFNINASVGFDVAVNNKLTMFKPGVKVFGSYFFMDNLKLSASLGYRFDKTWLVSENVIWKAGVFSLIQGYELERKNKQNNWILSAEAVAKFKALTVGAGIEDRNSKFWLCADMNGYVGLKAPVGFDFAVSAETPLKDTGAYSLEADVVASYEFRDFEKTISEMFVFRSLKTGLWCGTGYTKSGIGRLVVGAAASCDIKFLGIISSPVQVKIGWDFKGKKAEYSIKLGF